MSTALDIARCFEFAKKLTLEAGKILICNFENEKHVEIKGEEWEIVTEYDRKVQQTLIKELMKEFPKHKFIAEEIINASDKPKLTDEPTWIIDLVDGTYNFTRAFPQICISVGLVVCKEPVIGIIYNPINSELYTAIKGEGAFLNGKRIYTSKITELKKALLMHEPTMGYFIKDTKMQDIIKARTIALLSLMIYNRNIGSAALSMAYIARGIVDCLQQEYLQPWDVAAGTVIIREAGGSVVNMKGGAFDIMNPQLIAAANEVLAQKLSKFIVDIDLKTQRKRLQRTETSEEQ